jgi:NAD(P)-dependent dehydrogenase (short-subunit alcohol dehydrogenase family)
MSEIGRCGRKAGTSRRAALGEWPLHGQRSSFPVVTNNAKRVRRREVALAAGSDEARERHEGSGMSRQLEGRVALVTGASKGIGREIAAAFAAAGAQVMISARKEEGLRRAASEIGHDVQFYAVNAGDPEGADRCVARTIECFGALDILVNNAGTNPHFGRTIDVDTGKFDKTLQVNLRGPLFWCQAAWRRAFLERPGVILNMSSSGGGRVSENLGLYAVSKSALNHLTRQLAYELAPTRVVGIAPGLIQTGFSEALVGDAAVARAAALPVGRLGVPQDIAALATFLASDDASFITGETYVADGGATSVPTAR